MYKILLVDDERSILEGLRFILESAGRDWVVAGLSEDGQEGYELALKEEPDIIISDVKMPVMDGIEMIEKLKEAGCQAKYILLSGYSEFEYARQAIHLGVKFYICKPIEEMELFQMMEKVCDEISEERNAREQMIHLEHQVANFKRMAESFEKARAARQKQESDNYQDVIGQIKDYIKERYTMEISLNELAGKFFLNPYYLSQMFKKKTGMTYQSYVTSLRVEKAKQLFREKDYKVYEVCELVGYSDTAYFSKVFEKAEGCKPSEYRRLIMERRKKNE